MSAKAIKTIDKVVDKISKKKPAPKKAKPVQRTKADIEKAKALTGTFNVYEPRDLMIEDANKLYFLEGKTKAKQSKSGLTGEGPKKTYYWVLKDKDGKGVARSYGSKARRIDAIRDAIEALGTGIWSHRHHIPNDDDYDRVVDEGIRLKLIEEV